MIEIVNRDAPALQKQCWCCRLPQSSGDVAAFFLLCGFGFDIYSTVFPCLVSLTAWAYPSTAYCRTFLCTSVWNGLFRFIQKSCNTSPGRSVRQWQRRLLNLATVTKGSVAWRRVNSVTESRRRTDKIIASTQRAAFSKFCSYLKVVKNSYIGSWNCYLLCHVGIVSVINMTKGVLRNVLIQNGYIW